MENRLRGDGWFEKTSSQLDNTEHPQDFLAGQTSGEMYRKFCLAAIEDFMDNHRHGWGLCQHVECDFSRQHRLNVEAWDASRMKLNCDLNSN